MKHVSKKITKAKSSILKEDQIVFKTLLNNNIQN